MQVVELRTLEIGRKFGFLPNDLKYTVISVVGDSETSLAYIDNSNHAVKITENNRTTECHVENLYFSDLSAGETFKHLESVRFIGVDNSTIYTKLETEIVGPQKGVGHFIDSNYRLYFPDSNDFKVELL